jgi:glycosyltransferase involved in cell wall biosynthesis
MASNCRSPPGGLDGLGTSFVVGHGRVTGGDASRYAKDNQLNYVHFVHTWAEHLDPVKDGSAATSARLQLAEERTEQEYEFASQAVLSLGVGPYLGRMIATEIRGYPDASGTFVPGFEARKRERNMEGVGIRVLLVGRLNDKEVKGVDIAAAAVGHFARSMPGKRVDFVLRGAEVSADARAEIEGLVNAANVSVLLRPYVSQVSRLEDEMLSATVVLMPSRTEGFGLMAQEALVLGVPCLVSDQSGLGMFLKVEDVPLSNLIVLPVTGSVEVDGPVWGDAIYKFVNSEEVLVPAIKLRIEALGKRFSWSTAVAGFVKQLTPHA